MKSMLTVRLVLVLATAVSGTVSLHAQSSTSPKTLTGVVSDSMCGQTHVMKGKSDAECVRACVKDGMKYALVVGKTVYTLEGDEAELDKYAGQKVMLTGAVNGESVAVKSVTPAKQ